MDGGADGGADGGRPAERDGWGAGRPDDSRSAERDGRASVDALRGVVLITGTGTGVGKTTATAALAVRAASAGLRVVVVKPVQTGVGPHDPGDVHEIQRLLTAGLAGSVECHEFVRLPEPMAPQAAALLAGVRLPPLAEHAERIAKLAADADLVLVEGAGGLLVRLEGTGAEGGTIADLARLVPAATGVVVVAGPELGTLNVTELTVEGLRRRGVPVVGVVIGNWPAAPGPVERANLRDLPALTGVPLLGLVPELASHQGVAALLTALPIWAPDRPPTSAT
jgi:dethiobiotin synthase